MKRQSARVKECSFKNYGVANMMGKAQGIRR